MQPLGPDGLPRNPHRYDERAVVFLDEDGNERKRKAEDAFPEGPTEAPPETKVCQEELADTELKEVFWANRKTQEVSLDAKGDVLVGQDQYLGTLAEVTLDTRKVDQPLS